MPKVDTESCRNETGARYPTVSVYVSAYGTCSVPFAMLHPTYTTLDTERVRRPAQIFHRAVSNLLTLDWLHIRPGC